MSNLSVTPMLVDQLFELPSHLRGKTLLAAATVKQRTSFDSEPDIGLVRASFATYWENRYAVGIPFQAMRELLDPPIPVSHVLGFCLLNYCVTITDLSTGLANLADDLNREMSKSQSPKQACLFSKGDDDFEKHIKKSPFSGKSVDDLKQLAESDCKFPTIYADPPWMYDNRSSRGAAENHYPTMPVDEICRLPISELSDDNAHLHLWTTNAFLRDSFRVIEAWGFEYKSCLVWIKDELGMGNYWRVSHEYLLFGVRGNLRFQSNCDRSWLKAKRTSHSRKPSQVRALIEKVSPGPYLELFGREALPFSSWTVFGNQVEHRLF